MPVVTRRRSYAPGDDVQRPSSLEAASHCPPLRRRSTGGSRHIDKKDHPADNTRVLQERKSPDAADFNAACQHMQDSGSSRKPSEEQPTKEERSGCSPRVEVSTCRPSATTAAVEPPANASPSTTAAEYTPRKSPSTSSSSEALTPGTILLREYTRHVVLGVADET